jgi:anti-sigma-K factor RskA
MAMTTNPNEERDAAEALIPWYATGKLDEPDRRQVEEALMRWPELRESLRLAEEEQAETIAANESLGAPSPRAWARISAAIAAEPRRPPASARFASSLARLLGLGAEARPTRLAWIAAAAALVIVAEGGALLALAPWRSGATYQTATETAKEGTEVLITFVPDARIGEITAFLEARHGSIDEGPRGGMYRMRFGDKRLSTEERDALVKDLRAAPIVRMALPAGE